MLAAFDEVTGQDTKFLSEGLGEMTEIGEPDLAAGLFDAALTGDQEVLGALQAALVVIIVERMAIHLFEEIL